MATNPFLMTQFGAPRQFGAPSSFLTSIGAGLTPGQFGGLDIKKKLRQQSGLLYGLGQAGIGQREQERGLVLPEYQKLLTDPGYSPEERSAIMQEALGSTTTGFDVARDRAENLAARTGNRAGYNSLIGELGREEARTKAGLTRENVIDFANEAYRRRLAGMQGLAHLYGIDTGFLANMMGQQLGATGLELERLKGKRGALATISAILGIGRQVGGGAFGGGALGG